MAMQFAFKMMRHPKEAAEFQNALNAIQPVMTNPKASREEKRSMLNVMVNGLSEDTFKLQPIAEGIMTIINMKEDVSKEYKDSESQVDGILSWLPRMKEYRGMLLKEVKRNRKSFGLKV